ncbi:MAG TPA: biotin/lipoyl-containing protein, partial [Candidatus Dormibacteraeota bacterium]|nr:biotin/lipoyl-containing protein [Candidatus Dormibacteraeota bacterium]
MPIDVRMPKLSDTMESGVIIRWMKAPGDAVTKGDPLAEVETDKADVELEASESGVLKEITVAEGQSAAVGAVIAVLAADGEATGEGGDGSPRATSAGRGEAKRGPAPAAASPPPARREKPAAAPAPAAAPR